MWVCLGIGESWGTQSTRPDMPRWRTSAGAESAATMRKSFLPWRYVRVKFRPTRDLSGAGPGRGEEIVAVDGDGADFLAEQIGLEGAADFFDFG